MTRVLACSVAIVLLLAGCGASDKAQSPKDKAAPSTVQEQPTPVETGCKPKPCATTDLFSVTITNMSDWPGGIKLQWTIANSTPNEWQLSSSAGLKLLTADGTEAIDKQADYQVNLGNVSGCPARQSAKVPANGNKSSDKPVCLAVKKGLTPKWLRFKLYDGVNKQNATVEVPLK